MSACIKQMKPGEVYVYSKFYIDRLKGKIPDNLVLFDYPNFNSYNKSSIVSNGDEFMILEKKDDYWIHLAVIGKPIVGWKFLQKQKENSKDFGDPEWKCFTKVL